MAGLAPDAQAEPRAAASGSPLVSVVVPVFNALAFLPTTVPAILTAARQHVAVELIFVDNGSTDGSLEYLQAELAGTARIERLPGVSIARLRNCGAAWAHGDYISFLDADCLVAPEYFQVAVETLRSTGAAATGCEVLAPSPPHWLEAAWHGLHYVGQSRYVHYINSANFFVARSAFEQIGGFREDLRTGEDADIGQRLLEAGLPIYEDTRVAAVHLGNPKSVPQFFRRATWHALGMFATAGWGHLDKPTAMMVGHLLASLCGLLLLFATPWPLAFRIGGALALQVLMPVLTVAYRAYQTGRIQRLPASVLLYWLYYWARLRAVAVILSGRAGHFSK